MPQLITSPVGVVSSSEQECVISALVLAFSADPAARWMYLDSQQYLTYFPKFIRAFSATSFTQNTAYSNENYSGAALWIPPGIEPDAHAIGELLQNSIAESEQAEVFSVFEEMEHYHPKIPHWYLSVLGVDPAHQKKGLGSALLQSVLNECDRHQIPAYLESSNPANVPFYQRHGFEVMSTIQVGNSPRIFPMIRYPN